MEANLERKLLQIIVAVAGLVPVSAGLAGALLGPDFVAHIPQDVIPMIERNTMQFRLLTTIVFIGGLARILGIVIEGLPSSPMLFGLIMEIVVTPLLCAWQGRVARRCAEPVSMAAKA